MNVEPWSTLASGEAGSAARGMQHLLRAHGSEMGTDGRFGPATTEAVSQFQGAHGLPVDGVAGLPTGHVLMIPKSE